MNDYVINVLSKRSPKFKQNTGACDFRIIKLSVFYQSHVGLTNGFRIGRGYIGPGKFVMASVTSLH